MCQLKNRGEEKLNKTKAAILIGVILLISSNLVMLANASNNEGSLNSGRHKQLSRTKRSNGSQCGCYSNVHKPPRRLCIVHMERPSRRHIVWTEPINVFHNGTTYNGKLVYYAISTHKPEIVGDWGVQAKFYDEYNFCHFDFDIRLATRATSFNVVPELPLIGTAGASVAMVLGLALFKAKRKPL